MRSPRHRCSPGRERGSGGRRRALRCRRSGVRRDRGAGRDAYAARYRAADGKCARGRVDDERQRSAGGVGECGRRGTGVRRDESVDREGGGELCVVVDLGSVGIGAPDGTRTRRATVPLTVSSHEGGSTTSGSEVLVVSVNAVAEAPVFAGTRAWIGREEASFALSSIWGPSGSGRRTGRVRGALPCR